MISQFKSRFYLPSRDAILELNYFSYLAEVSAGQNEMLFF
jgi:hypothetical protein